MITESQQGRNASKPDVSKPDASKPVHPDRRDSILRAAEALIVEKGLEGFRIRDVAERAGMHHATMLHHYPNREALIRGVVDGIVAGLDQVPAPRTPQDTGSAADALRAHFAQVLRQMQAHPERFVVLNELFVRAGRDAQIGALLAATDASWHGYLIPLLEVGLQRGEFRAGLDPHATATLITSFFKGLSVQPGLRATGRQGAAEQLERLIVQS